MKEICSVILVYLIISCGFLFSLCGQTGQIPMGDGSGDGFQFLWNFWWTKQALLSEQTLFFTEDLFAPLGTPLVLHTLSPTNGILSIPFQWLFPTPQGVIVAYNTLVIGHFVFLASIVHLFCRYLGSTHLSALIAALLVAFLPYRLYHLHHINLLSTGWLITAIWALHTINGKHAFRN